MAAAQNQSPQQEAFQIPTQSSPEMELDEEKSAQDVKGSRNVGAFDENLRQSRIMLGPPNGLSNLRGAATTRLARLS